MRRDAGGAAGRPGRDGRSRGRPRVRPAPGVRGWRGPHGRSDRGRDRGRAQRHPGVRGRAHLRREPERVLAPDLPPAGRRDPGRPNAPSDARCPRLPRPGGHRRGGYQRRWEGRRGHGHQRRRGRLRAGTGRAPPSGPDPDTGHGDPGGDRGRGGRQRRGSAGGDAHAGHLLQAPPWGRVRARHRRRGGPGRDRAGRCDRWRLHGRRHGLGAPGARLPLAPAHDRAGHEGDLFRAGAGVPGSGSGGSDRGHRTR